MKHGLIAILGLAVTLATSSIWANSTKERTLVFISAFEEVRQPEVDPNVFQRYVSFMADDVVDYHAAYGVRIEGKEKPIENLVRKLPDNISFSIKIEDLIVGSSTAVVVLNETSEYKKEGEYKRFVGRTIIVLEFNEQGLIKEMRRYLD